MSGPGEGEQQHGSQDTSSCVELPRDVWSLILAAASAPLRQLPSGEDGRTNVAGWRSMALVCKQWHDIMLHQPVGLRVNNRNSWLGGARHPPPPRSGSDRAVLAINALADSRMPVCSLHVTVGERTPASEPENRTYFSRQTDMTVAMCKLFESKHFQTVSGPHLTDIRYSAGFVLRAPSEAFPKLRHLSYVHTRLPAGLPGILQVLGLKGDLSVSFGSGFISATEVGARTDHAISCVAPLHQLSKLSFDSCHVSSLMLAALPPSLTHLRLHQCQVPADEADFPPQLCRTSYEVDHAGLFSGTFELAAGMVIHDPRRQLAPAALP